MSVKRFVVITVALALVLSMFSFGVTPSAKATDYSYFRITGATIDAEYSGTPTTAAVTVTGTLNIYLGYSGTYSSAQTFDVKIVLERDREEDSSYTTSFTAPDVSTSTVKKISFTLNTAASTISYIKVKAKIKDSISGSTYTTEDLVFYTNAPYVIKDLKVDGNSFTKLYVGGSYDILQAKAYDIKGNPSDGYDVGLKYAPTGVDVSGIVTSLTNGIITVLGLSFSGEGDYILYSGIATATIPVRYKSEVKLLSSESSTYQTGSIEVKSGDQVAVLGIFTDYADNPATGVDVCVFDPSGNQVGTTAFATTDSNGKFNFFFDTTGKRPGTYTIGVCGSGHGHDYATITVVGKEYSISTSVSEVYKGLPRTQDVTVTVYDTDGDEVTSAPVYYEAKIGTYVIHEIDDTADAYTNSDGQFTITLPENLPLGTLTIKVLVKNGDEWGQASTNIPVVVPDKISFQLSGLSSPLKVQDYTVGVTALSNLNPPATIDTVKVEVSGPADVSGLPDDGIIDNGDTFTLKVLRYGEVKFTLTATDSEGNVVTKIFTYEVEGYLASYPTSEFTVGQTKDIVVVVKDGSGTEINNAVVKLKASQSEAFELEDGTKTDELSVSGLTANIVDGRYVFENIHFLKACYIDVFVYKSDGTTLMFREYAGMRVNPVYDLKLTVSPDKIVADFSTDVSFSLRDQDGDGVSGTIKVCVDSCADADNVVAEGSVSSYSPTLTLTLNLEPGKYVVEALSEDLSHGARGTLQALEPKIVLSPSDKLLTAGEEEELSATITNPLTGEPMTVDKITLLAVNASVETDTATEYEDVSSFSIKLKAGIEDTSTSSYISIVVENESKEILQQNITIKPPVLDVSPRTAYAGVSNSFTIKLTDAHGNPLADRDIKIYQGELLVGSVKTDANGVAEFAFVARTTGILTFKYGDYASVDVSIQTDLFPPKIISVSPTTATVGTDVIKLKVVAVDGETRVAVVKAYNYSVGSVFTGYVPEDSTGTVTVEVPVRLAEGENDIIVWAEDLAGNGSPHVPVKVFYSVPRDTAPPVIVRILAGSTPVDTATKLVVDRQNVKFTITMVEEGSGVSGVYAINLTTGQKFEGIVVSKPTGTVTAVISVSLAEGDNDVMIWAEDKEGNSSEPVSLIVEYKPWTDENPPQIVSIDPPDGATVTQQTVEVKMIVQDETAVDSVYVDFSPVVTGINQKVASVKFKLSLKEGKNVFTISVRDTVGNITTFKYHLIYQNPNVIIELKVGSPFYKVNGKRAIMDVSPFIDPRYGRTMVPVRFIAEAMGLDVGWDPETKTVLIEGNIGGQHNTIKIYMSPLKKVNIKILGEEKTVYEASGLIEVNGVKLNMASSGMGVPMIYSGRTFVPIRFIAEVFGCDVEWVPPDTVKITCPRG